MDVGDKIRVARTIRKMTQGELAERAGLAQNSLSAIERNERSPRVVTLEAIARAMGVPTADLLPDDPSDAPMTRVLEGRPEPGDLHTLDWQESHWFGSLPEARAFVERLGEDPPIDRIVAWVRDWGPEDAEVIEVKVAFPEGPEGTKSHRLYLESPGMAEEWEEVKDE